jgi:hypothetical protein
MKQTLIDIQVEYDESIPIYCDNTSAINISKNPMMLTGEIDSSSTGGVNPVRGCLLNPSRLD